MWRRAYLFLLLVRLYFALSPSYLHPDENFQGPEVIAGHIFSYPVKLTWEFTSTNPIRSFFPLWLVYGLPMLVLKWLWAGNGNDGDIPPAAVFWTLRVLMFALSFVLEDWAIHELIHSPQHRKVAVMLVASSYVTWTYQTHTFSNSIETLAVAWSLVLIQRIVEAKKRSSILTCSILALVVVFGIFNRITFPAFLIIPGLRLIHHFVKKPLSLISMVLSAAVAIFIAVYFDTHFYSKTPVTWYSLIHHPVITPLNNLTYNLATSNLAKHGLHPYYQHALINLPQLIGPAFILLFTQPYISLRLSSALSGIFALSVFQHQEARFLLPAVPLLLTSIKLPRNKTHLRIWGVFWIVFNLFFGLLMGVFHQGGVVPAQLFLSHQPDATTAIWWKTYSPPIWLLNGKNSVLTTHDAMSIPGSDIITEIGALATCYILKENISVATEGTYLIAPLSAAFLDDYIRKNTSGLQFNEVWKHNRHLNLDDLDFGDDGVWPTLKRVVGKRGLAVWRVTKSCYDQ
ncbi:Alg9-like mannosyltransferase [Calycina marina]|uniref:Mannosyltransferase n=1 Tax=Calycina marina TaxID=1763456 RepID=A0A9P7Z302_9HELO|nr:Alg9-like mannosyltransferase [Calycina marina]